MDFVEENERKKNGSFIFNPNMMFVNQREGGGGGGGWREIMENEEKETRRETERKEGVGG